MVLAPRQRVPREDEVDKDLVAYVLEVISGRMEGQRKKAFDERWCQSLHWLTPQVSREERRKEDQCIYSNLCFQERVKGRFSLLCPFQGSKNELNMKVGTKSWAYTLRMGMQLPAPLDVPDNVLFKDRNSHAWYRGTTKYPLFCLNHTVYIFTIYFMVEQNSTVVKENITRRVPIAVTAHAEQD